MRLSLRRTIALLAILLSAGPTQLRAADSGTSRPSPNTIASADKAAEAKRLSALAAEYAQRAADLEAQSKLAAPAQSYPATATPKSDWSPRGGAEVQILDVNRPVVGSNWRAPQKSNDAEIRFSNSPPTAAKPAETREHIQSQAKSDERPGEVNSEVTQRELAANFAAAQSTSPTTSTAEAAADRHIVNDENLRLASRMYQEDTQPPVPEPVPVPTRPYDDRNDGARGNQKDADKHDPDQPHYNSRSGDCAGNACECCPPPRMLFWTAGVEASFLNPDLNADGASFEAVESSEGRDDFSATFNDDVDSIYMTPRVWLGVQGCKWGIDLRYWHLRASEGGFDPTLGSNGEWDGPNCGIPNFGSNTCNTLEAYTIDLEFNRHFCVGDCWMQFSGGVRHAEVDHDQSVFGTMLAEDATFFGFGRSNSSSRGTGIVLGSYGRRPIFPCSCVNWFYNARWSALWGPTDTSAETGVMEFVTTAGAVGGAASVNGASTHVSDTLFIGEIQVGLEWDYALRCLPANTFFRAAIEYQRWDGGKGSSEANSFAGVAIDDVITGEAFTSATALAPELDLFGLSLGTGLTW